MEEKKLQNLKDPNAQDLGTHDETEETKCIQPKQYTGKCSVLSFLRNHLNNTQNLVPNSVTDYNIQTKRPNPKVQP